MKRAWVLWIGLAVSLAGCKSSSKPPENIVRPQSGEEDPEALATVGQKTTPGNAEPIAVSGVGLVYHLAGTGSSPPQGGWRAMLEESLKKQSFTNLKEILDDPGRSTSLVLVTALIPSGARKGDPIDLQISLPDESKTTSLKGGVLYSCDLYSTETTGNLQSMINGSGPSAPSGKLLTGTKWASGQGALVAGTFTTTSELKAESSRDLPADDGPPALRNARIWGGGQVLKQREYFLLLNPGDQTISIAHQIAEQICTNFHSTNEPGNKLAQAKTKELVVVNVPSAYRYNHYRFMLVTRQVPLIPIGADSPYRRRLAEQLLDPSTSLTAAIKLEALGGDSQRQLRLGLRSDSPWVRFAAAEALAYLGLTDGARDLSQLAEDHPALRAACLTALASLDDGVSTDRLAELMANPDPELRYGAFVALRMVDEHNVAVQGQQLNQSLWLHRVAQGSPGLIHLTSDRRAEVVVFGDGARLRGPFTLPVGSEYSVSMSGPDAEVRVSRVIRVKGEAVVREEKCTSDLAEVLVRIAKLGGGYSEAVDLLRRADQAQVMSVALALDAMPRAMNIKQLSGFAKTDPALTKADVEVAKLGVLRQNLDQVSADLPDPEKEGKPIEVTPVRPPLSQNPGRLFGPKRQPETIIPPDPLTPVK